MDPARSMRAVMVEAPGPPDVLKLTTVPIPEPGPAQVRLKVAYVGMNPLDALVRRERLDWLPVSYPYTPGIEHSGIVDAVGVGVDTKLIGSRVLSRLGFGGYADYSLAPAQGLLRLPDSMDMKTGAAYRGCTATAWYALHAVGHVQPGDRVLIYSAAGAVGGMAMQIAADAGAHVCGLAGGPDKVAFARDILSGRSGAVLDYLAPGWVEEAHAVAGPGGFDIILDGNGGAAAANNIALIGVLGRIIYIGATSGVQAPSVPPGLLIGKSFSVAGFSLRSVEARLNRVADPIIDREVTAGRWRPPISEIAPLADVAALHARLEARQVKGRALIEVNGEIG